MRIDSPVCRLVFYKFWTIQRRLSVNRGNISQYRPHRLFDRLMDPLHRWQAVSSLFHLKRTKTVFTFKLKSALISCRISIRSGIKPWQLPLYLHRLEQLCPKFWLEGFRRALRFCTRSRAHQSDHYPLYNRCHHLSARDSPKFAEGHRNSKCIRDGENNSRRIVAFPSSRPVWSDLESLSL